MIQNCQQFEARIQELMDQRVDPETDQFICAHVADCEKCSESLMDYSVLHTTYLNDSDSMKIKLENLGLHEIIAKRKAEKPERRNLAAIIASLAAAILLFTSLAGYGLWQGSEIAPVAAVSMTSPQTNTVSHLSPVSFESFLQVKRRLDRNEIYGSLTELPGICPFKALSTYFDWLHQSWSNVPQEESSPDVGHLYELNPAQQYSSNLMVAARI